jgi:hypothetical protein
MLPFGVRQDKPRKVFGSLEQLVEEGAMEAGGAIPSANDRPVVTLEEHMIGFPSW